ncbi:MAG: hypothetical protein AAGF84_09010 [Planctomycetota bacterium]
MPDGSRPSAVVDLSADGTTIIGNGNGRGFRWGANSGFTFLEPLPTDLPPTGVRGGPTSSALAITADGREVIGTSTKGPVLEVVDGPIVPGFEDLFPYARYSRVNGSWNYGDSFGEEPALPDGLSSGRFSADGRRAVAGPVSIWDRDLGRIVFDFEEEDFAQIQGISGDGSRVVVSRRDTENLIEVPNVAGGGTTQAHPLFTSIWEVDDSGNQSLLAEFRGADSDYPSVISSFRGLSADGTTVVGRTNVGPFVNPALPNTVFQAFRWTAGKGLELLTSNDQEAVSPLDNYTRATGVSGDGSVIIGESSIFNESTPRSFVWTEPLGMMATAEFLSLLGLKDELAGWKLEPPSLISDDGTVIIGPGTNPSGEADFWIATIPEPGTLGTAALVFVALSMRLRRRAMTESVD